MTNTRDETTPIEVWCCPECAHAHLDIDDAIDCCALPPPLQSWQCRGCEAVYGDQDEARLCCFDEDGAPLPPSARELEAAGQTRLAL